MLLASRLLEVHLDVFLADLVRLTSILDTPWWQNAEPLHDVLRIRSIDALRAETVFIVGRLRITQALSVVLIVVSTHLLVCIRLLLHLFS